MRTKYLCESEGRTPFGFMYDNSTITIFVSSKRIYYQLRSDVKEAFGLIDRPLNDRLERRRFVMEYSDVTFGQVSAGIACLQNLGWTVTPTRSIGVSR